jgi:CRISPR-associated protein Cmr4
VRSLYGTFAWITSPLALDRLRRDLADAGTAAGLPQPLVALEEKILLPTEPATALKGTDQKVYLADLDLTAEPSVNVSTWADKLAGWLFPDEPAWKPEFRKRFGVVGENCFNFLCETATEVIPRVRIDPAQKTVQRGALWYEEYLPAETILAGLVWCDRVFGGDGATPTQLMKDYCSGTVRLQLGGKATVGKGRVRCIFGGNHAR